MGWSYYLNCIFEKTEFNDIDFEGAIFSNLKIKDVTILNPRFNNTFPTKFYKSNSDKSIDVKNQFDCKKVLEILSNM